MPNQNRLRVGRYSQSFCIYHITSATSQRQPLFADSELARAASRCFINPVVVGQSSLLCWVLMPDHAHWLVQIEEGDSLSQWVKRVKAVSAREVNRLRGVALPVWQAGFYDHALRRDEELLTVARYIVANPIRSGLVSKVGQYPYWDAMWI